MKHLAIVGSGASAVYLLRHLLDHASRLGLRRITIFEKLSIMGMGMPYNPLTTDVHNLSNISSEELPALPVSFADWLHSQDGDVLRALRVDPAKISAHGFYSRLALGRYLHEQYQTLISRLAAAGVEIREVPGCRIRDICDDPNDEKVTVIPAIGDEVVCDRVIIATGHTWPPDDDPGNGYFASPWPIFKLLPPTGDYLNFTIATIGASLSAFDVVTSLAHHHGEFHHSEGELQFHPHPGADGFRIAMHSSKGLLPHLQYEQDRPIREIYRHAGRKDILSLADADGFLRLEDFFNVICRPVLLTAFESDRMPELVELLHDPSFSLEEFIAKLTDEHDYPDAFEGMELELKEARKSAAKGRPMHWKEVIDDLLYMLNYHAEMLPAEDHLILKSKLMPFVMNIVAALPLPSAEILLALRDAGKLALVTGEVTVTDHANGATAVTIENESDEGKVSYRMLVDCRGQKSLELEEYPFPSLVADGRVRSARAPFADPATEAELPEEIRKFILRTEEGTQLLTGGVDIDPVYRIVGTDGVSNPRIHDIAFPHTSGVRPYSYGLQACSDTAEIVVRAWCEERETGSRDNADLEQATKIYAKI